MTEVLLWLETHQMPRHQGEADQVASRGQEEEEEEEVVVVVVVELSLAGAGGGGSITGPLEAGRGTGGAWGGSSIP